VKETKQQNNDITQKSTQINLYCGSLQKHMRFETVRSKSSKVVDFGTNQSEYATFY